MSLILPLPSCQTTKMLSQGRKTGFLYTNREKLLLMAQNFIQNPLRTCTLMRHLTTGLFTSEKVTFLLTPLILNDHGKSS
jgi:hypothetical protein